LQIRGLFPYRESAEIIFQHITFEANPQKLIYTKFDSLI